MLTSRRSVLSIESRLHMLALFRIPCWQIWERDKTELASPRTSLLTKRNKTFNKKIPTRDGAFSGGIARLQLCSSHPENAKTPLHFPHDTVCQVQGDIIRAVFQSTCRKETKCAPNIYSKCLRNKNNKKRNELCEWDSYKICYNAKKVISLLYALNHLLL